MTPSFLRPFAGLPARFWVLWGATLMNRLGGFVVPFLALFLGERRAVTPAQVGTVIAMFGAGSVIAGPLGGLLSDRFGRRTTIVLGMIGSALSMGGLAAAQTTIELMVATFALGLAMDTPRPAISAMVADLVPSPDRPRAYAALYWAMNLGFAFASIIAGAVASAAFEWLFVVDAVTCLACAAVIGLLLPETMPSPGFARAAQSFSVRDVAVPFRDGAFASFFAASLLIALVFFQFNVAMPLSMKAHGISNQAYGLLVALNGVLVVALSPFAAPLMLRLPRRTVLAGAALLTGGGFGLFGLGGSIPLYATGITVLTLGEVMFAPITPALIADLSPSHLRGTYQGTFQLSHSLGACLAPIGGGALLEHASGGVLWGTAFAVGLAAAVLYAVTPAARRPADAGQPALLPAAPHA